MKQRLSYLVLIIFISLTPLSVQAFQEPPADVTFEKVLLGSKGSGLLLGISGSGPISEEEIRGWLSQFRNHTKLTVELPLGLKKAAANIQGLQANPMTRAKIELGRQLYFDTRLSSDNTISCSSCHSVDQGFSATTQFGVGVNGQTGNRNSPISYNRIVSGPQFWDGRAGSLEDQAIGPIANPIEMGNTHQNVVKMLKSNKVYKMQFETIFHDAVSIENVGKAIAAFERGIVTGPSPFDYYDVVAKFEKQFADELEFLAEDDADTFAKYQAMKRKSNANPMSESAQRGYQLFFSKEVNCAQCHSGANLSDEKYHNLGVGMASEKPDLGRFAVTGNEADKGAFKTPTIRNVVFSPPYMHDGSQKTLKEVVQWYNRGGHANPHLSENVKKLNLTEQQVDDLVEFMKACTGTFPEIETGRLPE
jgi:cytochrome c peroxidase